MGGGSQERDLALLMKVRCLDDQACEELVRKYIPMVKSIVRSHLYDPSEFEDMMQEGLIGFLDAITEYDEGRRKMKFSSFAYLCIIRKIYNCLRRANNSKHKILNGAISIHSYIDQDENKTILDLLGGDGPNPEEVVESQWMTQKLSQVLRSHLSLLEYAVVILLLKGYTISEIETKIGVDAKCVDNARTRVRAKVRRMLRKYGSLLNPNIPDRIRKRRDLYIDIKGTNCGGVSF